MRKLLLAIPALVSLSACVMMPPPQAGGSGSSSMQSSGTAAMNEPATPASEPGSTSEPAAANKAPVPTSIEVHSDCPQTLPLFIGEKPKFGSGTKTSIGSNTTTTFPRRADGTQMIWIIDDSENGIASANVSTDTKRVEIDRDCKNITAR